MICMHTIYTKPKPVTPSTLTLHTHIHTFATTVLQLVEETLELLFVIAVEPAVPCF